MNYPKTRKGKIEEYFNINSYLQNDLGVDVIVC